MLDSRIGKGGAIVFLLLGVADMYSLESWALEMLDNWVLMAVVKVFLYKTVGLAWKGNVEFWVALVVLCVQV